MYSQHVDEFNHDPWAAGYDDDVRNEADPIRAGFAETLAWTVSQAQIGLDDVVIDLGSGAGNTTALIESAASVICVDISDKWIFHHLVVISAWIRLISRISGLSMFLSPHDPKG